MEELLRIAYTNFLNTEDEKTSECVRIINRHWKGIEDVFEELNKLLSYELCEKISDMILDGATEIQEAAFMAGFTQCAKFITNGKVNFFAMEESMINEQPEE